VDKKDPSRKRFWAICRKEEKVKGLGVYLGYPYGHVEVEATSK